MRWINLEDVLQLHDWTLDQSGGSPGLRELGALGSALAQPLTTFGGRDLYPTTVFKAAALGFSIVCNHPFHDGNKRTGHAAMETILVLNGLELNTKVDDQECQILILATGALTRDAFITWVEDHVQRTR